MTHGKKQQDLYSTVSSIYEIPSACHSPIPYAITVNYSTLSTTIGTPHNQMWVVGGKGVSDGFLEVGVLSWDMRNPRSGWMTIIPLDSIFWFQISVFE